jgi:hypothetical protein
VFRRFTFDKLPRQVDDVFSRNPRGPNLTDSETRQRIDAQENVLILFRELPMLSFLTFLLMWSFQGKLREGIYSSRRNDAFALEGTPNGKSC